MLRRLIRYQQSLRTLHGALQQGFSLQQSLVLLTPGQPLATLAHALTQGRPLHMALTMPAGIPVLDAPIADPLRYFKQLDQHITHSIDTLQHLGRRLIYPGVLLLGLGINACVMHTVVLPSVSTLGPQPTALTLYYRIIAAIVTYQWDGLLSLGLGLSLTWPWLSTRLTSGWQRLNRDWQTATALTGIHMRLTQGVPIHTCIHHAGILFDANTRVSDAIATAFSLNSDHRHRLAIGEDTGKLDHHLAGIIQSLVERHRHTVNRWIATLPVLLLIGIGGYMLIFFSVLFQPLSQSIHSL
ncbi:hypothetical protein N8762_00560 [Candidatus Marinamargulisbacteria bacterium]|nr:hypothetical protein [bacterium]MDA7563964.1 hypothetical protein [Candidatus Marinamargulisbacteria bacterium]|tara:strand:- start:853 stop:1746 length:894 start_codon:yes stop_codon:yes gene_type:complete